MSWKIKWFSMHDWLAIVHEIPESQPIILFVIFLQQSPFCRRGWLYFITVTSHGVNDVFNHRQKLVHATNNKNWRNHGPFVRRTHLWAMDSTFRYKGPVISKACRCHKASMHILLKFVYPMIAAIAQSHCLVKSLAFWSNFHWNRCNPQKNPLIKPRDSSTLQ